MDYLVTDTKFDSDNRINYRELREVMLNFAELQCYDTAVFWAEKLVSLSKCPKDIYSLAKYLFLSHDYHRAAVVITSRNLHLFSICGCYLASLCLYHAKQYDEANNLMENERMISYLESKIDSTDPNFDFRDSEIDKDIYAGSEKTLLSSIFLLKGRLFEALDRHDEAVIFFKDALYYNAFCIEAFDCLIRSQMLTLEEGLCEHQQKMLDLLISTHQLSDTNTSLLNAIYLSKMNKYYRPLPVNDYEKKILVLCQTSSENVGNDSVALFDDRFVENNYQPPIERLLQNSIDMMVPLAEKLFYNFEHNQCKKLLSYLLTLDIYHSDCLVIHIGCLVELQEKNNLFLLAHKLIDIYPDFAISWYAVGCYYYLNKSYEQARKYLLKATSKKDVFGPAWLLYGHSFAVENEHDRAMAAYFKASKLIKGCHLPFLYIGLQCSSTNNSTLAQKYFTQAIQLAPNDPFIKHEMGVVAFDRRRYKEAYALFTDAKKHFPKGDNTTIASKWEALLCNLGHTCRKLKKMNEALSYFQEALRLNSNSCHIYSSIGLVKIQLNCHMEAINWFHKALAIRRDDPFTTAIMNYALDDFVQFPLNIEGLWNEIPKLVARKQLVLPQDLNDSSIISDSDQNMTIEETTANDKNEIVSTNAASDSAALSTDVIFRTPSNVADAPEDFYSPLDMSIED